MFPTHPIPILPNSLTQRDQKARNWVIYKGKLTGNIEYAWIVLSVDNSKMRYRGKVGKVDLHPSINSSPLSKCKNYHFHHNHPTNQSLSDGDYYMLAMNSRMIRCFSHGHNGSMHCASWVRTPTIPLWKSVELMRRMFAVGFQAAETIGYHYHPKGSSLLKYFVPHMVGQVLHERGIISFSGLTTPSEVAIVNNDQLLFQVVLEAVRLTR
jgi:hypothetical protein